MAGNSPSSVDSFLDSLPPFPSGTGVPSAILQTPLPAGVASTVGMTPGGNPALATSSTPSSYAIATTPTGTTVTPTDPTALATDPADASITMDNSQPVIGTSTSASASSSPAGSLANTGTLSPIDQALADAALGAGTSGGTGSGSNFIPGLFTDIGAFFARWGLMLLAIVLIAISGWAMMHKAGIVSVGPGQAAGRAAKMAAVAA